MTGKLELPVVKLIAEKSKEALALDAENRQRNKLEDIAADKQILIHRFEDIGIHISAEEFVWRNDCYVLGNWRFSRKEGVFQVEMGCSICGFKCSTSIYKGDDILLDIGVCTNTLEQHECGPDFSVKVNNIVISMENSIRNIEEGDESLLDAPREWLSILSYLRSIALSLNIIAKGSL